MLQNSIQNINILQNKVISSAQLQQKQINLKHSISVNTNDESLIGNLSTNEIFSEKIVNCLTYCNLEILENNQVKYQITQIDNKIQYNKFNNYRIGQIIGKGTFGTVYKGIFLPKFHEVAIKIINFKEFQKQWRNDVINFYQNQVQLMDIIRQKGRFKFTAQFYGAFVQDDCGYIVMQFLQGFSLSSIIQSQIQLSKNQEQFYLASLILALEQLHSNFKILHRDIKPQNIMVLANGELLLLDFGCAKKLFNKHQRVQSITGTCQYFCPSRFKCNYGLEADIWSFGVTAYELATKKLPFSFKGIEDSFQQQKFLKLSSVIKKQKNIKLHELSDHHPHFKNLIQNIFNQILQTSHEKYEHIEQIEKIKKSQYFHEFQWDLLRRNKMKPPRTFSLIQINRIKESEIIFNNF